jgi:hypothetical protein
MASQFWSDLGSGQIGISVDWARQPLYRPDMDRVESW